MPPPTKATTKTDEERALRKQQLLELKQLKQSAAEAEKEAFAAKRALEEAKERWVSDSPNGRAGMQQHEVPS
jgi:hypothetical protein